MSERLAAAGVRGSPLSERLSIGGKLLFIV